MYLRVPCSMAKELSRNVTSECHNIMAAPCLQLQYYRINVFWFLSMESVQEFLWILKRILKLLGYFAIPSEYLEYVNPPLRCFALITMIVSPFHLIINPISTCELILATWTRHSTKPVRSYDIPNDWAVISFNIQGGKKAPYFTILYWSRIENRVNFRSILYMGTEEWINLLFWLCFIILTPNRTVITDKAVSMAKPMRR